MSSMEREVVSWKTGKKTTANLIQENMAGPERKQSVVSPKRIHQVETQILNIYTMTTLA